MFLLLAQSIIFKVVDSDFFYASFGLWQLKCFELNILNRKEIHRNNKFFFSLEIAVKSYKSMWILWG